MDIWGWILNDFLIKKLFKWWYAILWWWGGSDHKKMDGKFGIHSALRASRTFLIPYPTPTASKAVNPPSIGQYRWGSTQGFPGSAYNNAGKKIKQITNKHSGKKRWPNRFIADV